jgi:hypothetical protein
MLLRQTEGFMGLAILIHIAEIRLAIEAIVALRGKTNQRLFDDHE